MKTCISVRNENSCILCSLQKEAFSPKTCVLWNLEALSYRLEARALARLCQYRSLLTMLGWFNIKRELLWPNLPPCVYLMSFHIHVILYLYTASDQTLEVGTVWE